MSHDDLAFLGVARQAELVRSRQVSSRELVELYLERIERLDPQLNAFRVVFAERALAEADQADARAKAGDERPLLGTPIAIKDNLDMAGEVSTNGSAAHGGPAAADADLVARLRAGGAVIVGKTHLPELAIMGATESPAFGFTRNPWDPGRTPGGSSGGSAAAVAAGLVAAASASDGGGSIRIPAACCGIFGLKPQRDRISLAPDREHWFGMSVYGCHTRSVEDTALWLDVVSHQRPPEPFLEAAQRRPQRLRVAISFKGSLPVPLHEEVRRGLDETAELLRSVGHDVVERDPDYGDVSNNFVPRYLAGIREDAKSMPHPDLLSRRTKGFARLGALFPPPLMKRVRADEARHRERINRIFEDCDVLMTPVTARPPVEVNRWEGMGAIRTMAGMLRVYPYCATWNATGQPAAAVPAGFTADGLPLSVQLIGPPDGEATLISLAAQIEAERPWSERRPPIS